VAAIARYDYPYDDAIAQRLMRITADGSSDLGFGSAKGTASIPTRQYEGGSNVRILPNGWIFVFDGVDYCTFNSDGSLRSNPWEATGVPADLQWQVIGDPISGNLLLTASKSDGSLIVVRLHPDGTVDPSFGAAGYVVIDTSQAPFAGSTGKASLDFVSAILSLDGQRLYVREFRQGYDGLAEGGMVRIRAAGAFAGDLDQGFGSHGYVPLPMPHAELVDQAPDSLLVSGPGGIFRLSANSGPSPGVIGLKHAYVDGLQSSTTMIPVVRFAGHDGTASVSFYTEDVYGKSGVNYVAMSGQLLWADGESANKDITLKLLQGSDTVGYFFRLFLQNPQGGAQVQESAVDVNIRLTPDPNGGISSPPVIANAGNGAAIPTTGIVATSGGGFTDPLSLLLLLLGGSATARARVRSRLK
jgi:hypothetical protein